MKTVFETPQLCLIPLAEADILTSSTPQDHETEIGGWSPTV